MLPGDWCLGNCYNGREQLAWMGGGALSRNFSWILLGLVAGCACPGFREGARWGGGGLALSCFFMTKEGLGAEEVCKL